MKIIFIIIGAIVLAIVIFVIYRLITVHRQNDQHNAEQFERVRELYDKLEKGETLTAEEVYPFAQNIRTRTTTYRLLEDYRQTALFPTGFCTLIKAAEGYLANWLEFPTELDACPDEIEHIKRVTFDFDGHPVHYEVFKYRINEPHWAAENGWMLGVAGPYFDDSKPYDFPNAAFSRISSTLDKVTPEEEAKWVHENITMRR